MHKCASIVSQATPILFEYDTPLTFLGAISNKVQGKTTFVEIFKQI